MSYNIIKLGIGQSCDKTDYFVLKLSGFLMNSPVDTAGDNQSAHVIISDYNNGECITTNYDNQLHVINFEQNCW